MTALHPIDRDLAGYDPRDPDPWLALLLDQSVPIDENAKADLMRSTRRTSRRALLPFVRPLAGLSLLLGGGLRALAPKAGRAPGLLHRMISRGLERVVAPEANRLILRHFHIGTEIIGFIRDNVPGAQIDTVPLRPRKLRDLADGMFVQHDLNLFNFVIQLNSHLRRTGATLSPVAAPDFSAITDAPFPLEDMPDGRLNVIDLQTAVVAYTPLYQLLLSDRDFWRASTSLQLDETIAAYVARILDAPELLLFVNNGHPLIPGITLNAGFRLMLHGLAAEQLHYQLRLRKRRAQSPASADGAPRRRPGTSAPDGRAPHSSSPALRRADRYCSR